jgi:carbon monoxide dehydrogenase subunit G
MRLEGSLEVRSKPSECLRRLRDPSWLSQCLPGLHSFECREPGIFGATFYLDLTQLSQLAGYLTRIRAEMSFRYEDAGNDTVKLLGEGRVVGAKIRLTIAVRVSPSRAGSLLNWQADADLGLVQRLLGESLIRKVAEHQIQRLTQCLSERLSSPQ